MAKSYEPCYTKTDSKGNTYKTCEGAQQKRKARANLKKGGAPPPMVKKKAQKNPEGFGNKFIFSRNMAGRVNTGTLNPANPNLNVNPWGTTPEIQANVPQSLGQQNLQLLLSLGDLSSKIESERQKLVSKDWYILPITYLIGELYKKGLRDFKGTAYENVGGTYGFGDVREGWSVVYQLRGDKMVNLFHIRMAQLHEQALTSFKKPSELTSREMLIDDVFDPENNEEAMKYLDERGNSIWEGYGRSLDVKGIKHLRDFNLSKDKWALKLGIKPRKLTPAVGPPTNNLEYYDFSINPWRNVPWAKDGEKLLSKLTTEANKKYVSENKDKLSKMTVKQLKEKVPSYRQKSSMKKQDYIDDILEMGKPFYGNGNDKWGRSGLIKNGSY